jgi:uncharacterized protein YegL
LAGKKAKHRTIIGIIQDKSGSMQIRRAEAISGYNEYIQTLKKEAEGEVLMTLTQFDTDFNEIYSGKPLADVEEFTERDYQPNGMTALYDAIGRTVRLTEQKPKKGDKVLIVIMTDGLENRSQEWSQEAVVKLMNDKRNDGWEFIFLGAGEDSWAVGQSLGFKESQRVYYSGVDVRDHRTSTKIATEASIHVTNRRGTAEQSLSSNPAKVRLEVKAKKEREEVR